jgi:hypothetical protein
MKLPNAWQAAEVVNQAKRNGANLANTPEKRISRFCPKASRKSGSQQS